MDIYVVDGFGLTFIVRIVLCFVGNVYLVQQVLKILSIKVFRTANILVLLNGALKHIVSSKLPLNCVYATECLEWLECLWSYYLAIKLCDGDKRTERAPELLRHSSEIAPQVEGRKHLETA